MPFTLATHNVLATAYIRPEWYLHTPKEFLDPRRRIPALVEHLVELRADILCLQEVEDAVYAALDQHLSSLGYAGSLAKKGHSRPDGCATFFRAERFEPVRTVRIEYRDAAGERPASGHVGQMLVLRAGGRLLGVANTHLKWDSPGVPRDERYGYRQTKQLLQERKLQAPECSGWVICGDFNVTPESDVVGLLRETGFEFTHAGFSGAATCNPNRRAKMIDFVFHDEALRAEPLDLPAVENETPLPGPGQPSDHVAVMARLEWRNAPPVSENHAPTL